MKQRSETQETTVIREIVSFILGRKYYANIIATRGVRKYEICSYIFRSKEEAEAHKKEIDGTLSFEYLETLSFRSRNNYL